ncbi:MAG TPA: S24 family peptidase [Chitinophagaceae bacterium]
MNVKDRLIEFIKHTELNNSQFEKEVSLSNGYINNIRKSIGEDALNKICEKYPLLNKSWLLLGEGEMIKSVEDNSNTSNSYTEKRLKLKNKQKEDSLTFYEVGASAGNAHSAEILPVKKNDGVLHISDLFKGSQYAIRISGNSMTPSYPSGAIIGIREIEDKQITPGSVYVIEKGSDLWIKRLFYKDDNQESGAFECVSDNTMKFENGPRVGKLYYPPFNISIDNVRKLFKVTGIYKPNELTVIS